MTIPDIQELQIGINNKFNFKKIQMKQYDKNTRQIDIYLLDSSGQIIDIPSTFKAKFQATKKDKKIVFDNCIISDNKITYIAKESLTSVAGEVECEIGLYETSTSGDTTNDKLIQSKTFYIDVEPSAMDRNAVESSDDFNTLTIMINNITGISAEAEQAIADINTAITNSEVATDKANTSVANVNEFIDTMNQKITESELATQSAITATDGVNTSISNAELATQNAITATSEANTATQNAITATYEANTATQKANTATQNANTATQNANTVTDKINRETLIIWKTMVATYNDIFNTYPNPELGWTTTAEDTGLRWRYNGTQWINIGKDSNSGIDISMIGNLEDLVTTDKSSVVNSINETNANIGISENNSKAYTDQQIALVTETGIPKLNVYEYKFYDQPIGTTIVQIPLETFDKNTDKVKLFINSVQRDSDFYTISDTGLITLNDALVTVSKVLVEVWKNIPLGDTGSVSGAVLAIDSVPQDRVIGLSDLATDVENLRVEREYANTTLSQDYKSIFNTGTGKDNDGMEQNFNNIANGQSNVKLEGLTANNLVKNGDFSNSSNEWLQVSLANWKTNNGVLSFTGNLVYARMYQTVPLISNNVYYCACKVRSTSNLVKLVLQRMADFDTLTASHSGSGKFERLSVLGNVSTTSSTSRVTVMDFRSTEWDDVSLANTVLINLTSLGLESLTKEQCDYMFDHYFNGLQGVGSGKLVSTGKNLFNVTKSANSILGGGTAYYIENNNIVIKNSIAGGWQGVGFYYNLRPNEQMYFCYNSEVVSGFQLGMCLSSDGSLLVEGNGSFIVPIDGFVEVRLHCTGASDTLGHVIYKNIQLVKGTGAPQYEPYKSSELITTMPSGIQLHRLPSGITDTIEEINGVRQLVKRVKENILQASDIVNISTSYPNLDYVEIKKPSDYIYYGKYGASVNTTLFDKYPTKHHDQETWNTVINIGYILGEASNNAFWLGVTKGTYTNLASAQSALTGIKMIYQLSQPVIYKNGVSGFSQVGNLEVYPNGTIYQEHINPKQSTNAKTYINYNLSTKAVIMSNSAEITRLSKNVIDKSMIVQNALSTNPDTVASGVALKNVQDQVNELSRVTNLGSAFLSDIHPSVTGIGEASIYKTGKNVSVYIDLSFSNATTDTVLFKFANPPLCRYVICQIFSGTKPHGALNNATVWIYKNSGVYLFTQSPLNGRHFLSIEYTIE